MNINHEMTAALLIEPGKFIISRQKTPIPKNGEALLKVQTCCLCGSDIRTFRYGNARTKLPAIIGHEISGIIVQTTSNCPLQVGDRVSVGADLPVKNDFWSKAGYHNLAEPNMALGYQLAGGLAEYCLLGAEHCATGPVCQIPDHLSFDSAALAEPIACCLNACTNTNISHHDNVIIFGAGPIGTLLARCCLLSGAKKVLLTDPIAERITIAQKLGLNAILLPEKNHMAALAAELPTDKKGFDVALTACISPQAIESAIGNLAKKGRLCLFAGYPQATNLNLNANTIHYKELTICGAHGSTPQQHKKAIELLAKGQLIATDIISQHFPLVEIDNAMATAQSLKSLKIAIHP